MKRLLSLLLLLALPVHAQDSESIADKAILSGASVDAANDTIFALDDSVTSGPAMKRIPIDEVVDIPSFFGGLNDGIFSIAKTSGLQAALDAKQATLVSATNIKTVNGSSLLGSGNLSIVSDLTSGPVTSSGGVSAIADGALSIAKTSGLHAKLDAAAEAFSSGKHHLPLVNTATFAASMFPETSRPPLTVGLFGDSLATQFGLAANAPALIRGVPFRGWKLPHISTGVGTGGASLLAHGYANANWTTPYYWKHTGVSTTTFPYSGGAAVDTMANRVGIGYFKGTGSSTLSLEYSQNGGSSWTTAATIDTSAAANNFTYSQYSLSLTKPTRVRVSTASGHTTYFVSAGAFWGDSATYSGELGYVIADMGYGGNAPTAAGVDHAQIFAALGIKLNLCAMDDSLGYGVGENFDQILAEADAGSAADWVMILTHPGGTATATGRPPLTVEETLVEQRASMVAWAERNAENYIDFSQAWIDFDTAVAAGYMASGDSIHPTTKGYAFRQRFIGSLLGDHLNGWQTGTLLNGDGSLRIEQNLYAAEINTRATQLNIYGGAGAGIGLSSQSHPSRNNLLTTYYTGQGDGTGMTHGVYTFETPGNVGSVKHVSKWTTAGNTGTNVTLSSDWPLAVNMKSSAPATPTSSATAHMYYNGTKWEFRIKTPSGTDHIIWTEP